MTLFSQILALDHDLTLAVNGLHSPLFDQFFYLFSSTETWLPFFVIFFFLLWRSYGWRTALSLLLAVALAVFISDQFCNIFKYTVCRLRPTHDSSLSDAVHIVNGYRGGPYGFCSSHAANTMAFALFSILVVRKWYYTLSISSWVLLNCWSRIYLGVHFLGDILCGLLIGAAMALLFHWLWRRSRWGSAPFCLSALCAKVLICSYFLTVLLLLAWSLYVGS